MYKKRLINLQNNIIRKYQYLVLTAIAMAILISIVSVFIEVLPVKKTLNITLGFIVGKSLFIFLISGLLPTLLLISFKFRKKPIKETLIDKVLFYIFSIVLVLAIFLQCHHLYVQHSTFQLMRAKLEKLVQNEKKHLPIKIDQYGSVIKIDLTKTSLHYSYLIKLSQTEIDNMELKTRLYSRVKTKYCHGLLKFHVVDPRLIYQFSYYDKDHTLFETISLTPKDCSDQAPSS